MGDHLGSTSLTTDANGTLVSELRYKAWGEVRYESGATPTKYTYTGQYSYTSDFGLMFYNARWVDTSLGRFAQADTIVPSAGNSQAYDRYAYSLNNPIKYVDPDGHESKDPCSYYGYGTSACPQTSPYTSTPTPAPTSTSAPMPTLVAICGSSAGGMDSPGPTCNGTPAGQMSIWNSNNIPGYNIIYSQYPGYHKYYDPNSPTGDPSEDTEIGKSGQAISLNNQLGNTSNVTVVGYSAGVDTAIYYAEVLKETGQRPNGIVLLGPSYPYLSYDTKGNAVDTEGFVTRVTQLGKDGVPILIIDDTGLYDGRFDDVPNVTYIKDPRDHEYTDDNTVVMQKVLDWMNGLPK